MKKTKKHEASPNHKQRPRRAKRTSRRTAKRSPNDQNVIAVVVTDGSSRQSDAMASQIAVVLVEPQRRPEEQQAPASIEQGPGFPRDVMATD